MSGMVTRVVRTHVHVGGDDVSVARFSPTRVTVEMGPVVLFVDADCALALCMAASQAYGLLHGDGGRE